MSQRALKFLVAGLAVAIALALVFVVYGMMRLVPAVTAPDANLAKPEIDLKLQQPAGSEIVSASVSDNELVAVIRGGGLPDRIVIANRATGQVKQTVWISDPP
jgi:hypothetical protein